MKSTVLAAAVLGVVWCSARSARAERRSISQPGFAGPVGAVTDVASRVTNARPAPVLQGNRPSAGNADRAQNARFERGRSVGDAERRRYPASQLAAALSGSFAPAARTK